MTQKKGRKHVAIPQQQIKTNVDSVVSILFHFDYFLCDCPKLIYSALPIFTNLPECYYRHPGYISHLCNSCIDHLYGYLQNNLLLFFVSCSLLLHVQCCFAESVQLATFFSEFQDVCVQIKSSQQPKQNLHTDIVCLVELCWLKWQAPQNASVSSSMVKYSIDM
jgi:hypothetical protein